jgi:hypothetical protein
MAMQAIRVGISRCLLRMLSFSFPRLLTDQAPFKAASNVVVAEELALGGLGPLATPLGE